MISTDILPDILVSETTEELVLGQTSFKLDLTSTVPFKQDGAVMKWRELEEKAKIDMPDSGNDM